MEQYRAIIALISALVGLSILAYAYIGFFRKKQKSGKAASIIKGSALYGMLFLAMAAVIWQKNERVDSITSEKTTVESKSAAQKPDSALIKEKKSPVSAQPVQNNGNTSEIVSNTNTSTVPLEQESIVRFKPQISSEKKNKDSEKDNSQRLPVEERIAVAVNRAFTFVEKFFNKYGTDAPSASSTNRRINNSSQDENLILQFPRISFENGSANLTRQSQSALKELANKLKRYSEIRLVEIQSYANDQSPEAFNFILSEARAQAVRDFLITEGVEENRLIARGFGSNPNDSLRILSSRIEFVARPQ